MKKLLAPFFAFFASCGDSSVETTNLVGTWVSNECPCLISAIFNKDGTYQYNTVCQSDDNPNELFEESENGSYSIEGEFVTLTENTEQSVSSFRFVFVDNDLRIIYPDDELVFEKQGGKQPVLSSFRFGCMDDDSFEDFPFDD